MQFDGPNRPELATPASGRAPGAQIAVPGLLASDRLVELRTLLAAADRGADLNALITTPLQSARLEQTGSVMAEVAYRAGVPPQQLLERTAAFRTAEPFLKETAMSVAAAQGIAPGHGKERRELVDSLAAHLATALAAPIAPGVADRRAGDQVVLLLSGLDTQIADHQERLGVTPWLAAMQGVDHGQTGLDGMRHSWRDSAHPLTAEFGHMAGFERLARALDDWSGRPTKHIAAINAWAAGGPVAELPETSRTLVTALRQTPHAAPTLYREMTMEGSSAALAAALLERGSLTMPINVWSEVPGDPTTGGLTSVVLELEAGARGLNISALGSGSVEPNWLISGACEITSAVAKGLQVVVGIRQTHTAATVLPDPHS